MNTFKAIKAVILALLLVPALQLAQEDPREGFNQAYGQYTTLVANRDFTNALPYAQQALELGREIYGEESTNTAALSYNYGLTLLELGRSQSAALELRQTLRLHRNLYGEEAVELISVLMDLGRAETMNLADIEARDYFNSAVEILESNIQV